jgi:RHH-type proline utilization regulon transcriptional repressor/proline dehydrogenase/delta 1-pyrroline-5-carboxylate dehydrogenase
VSELDRVSLRQVESIRGRLRELRGTDLDEAALADEVVRIAADLQRIALQSARREEAKSQARLARLVKDAAGQLFTTAMTDQVGRSHNVHRIADQVCHLIDRYSVPAYLSGFERAQLRAFRALGRAFPWVLAPLLLRRVRREMRRMVLPGRDPALGRYLARRAAEGVRTNLNQLGEAILGEREAEARLARYLEALARPDVECISVKISSIASQIELLAWDDVLAVLSERLRRLYRRAMDAPLVRRDGSRVSKLVYLDMEEYPDLHLTVELFKRVLDEPEFLKCPAGIVLQAYLPDSYLVQWDLVTWAGERVARGGVPIRIRIVKGANLAMERCEASERGWPQAPYPSKAEVDANYKRMILWGCRPENADVAHLGIGSHNLFDLTFGVVVRTLTGTEDQVGFEMLEGMAEPMRRALQAVADNVLVYSPAVPRAELQSAIAYLIRRFDENTGPENFLPVSFGLKPQSERWRLEELRFRESFKSCDDRLIGPRRTQDRGSPSPRPRLGAPFENEPYTDFSLAPNREWIRPVAERWRTCEPRDVPSQVAGQVTLDAPGGWLEGRDPSTPGRVLYRVALADEGLADRAITAAVDAYAPWAGRGIAERSRILAEVAQKLREARGDLIRDRGLRGVLSPLPRRVRGPAGPRALAARCRTGGTAVELPRRHPGGRRAGGIDGRQLRHSEAGARDGPHRLEARQRDVGCRRSPRTAPVSPLP